MIRTFHCCRGYTLVELMGVVAIAGLLMALAVPSYNNQLAKERLELTAAQLASDIRSLQQLALAEESSEYKIAFYYNLNNYTVSKGINTIKTVAMPTGIKLEATNFASSTLYINHGGLSTVGGTIILRDGKRSKYVIVASITGRVRVSDRAPNKEPIL